MKEESRIKIVAHRGWSMGKDENALEAFKKSVKETSVSGVEFDVRWNQKRNNIIISHNPDGIGKALELEEGLKFLYKENLELFIEMKEFDEYLFYRVLGLLNKYNLKQKAFIFGFKSIAVEFPWSNRNGVKLGIISEYPWEIKKDINNFKPDFILMGWDNRWWTKFIFKLVWSVFSLPKICKKYNNIDFVIGVAKSRKDYNWLNKQRGLYCLTADMPLN